MDEQNRLTGEEHTGNAVIRQLWPDAAHW